MKIKSPWNPGSQINTVFEEGWKHELCQILLTVTVTICLSLPGYSQLMPLSWIMTHVHFTLTSDLVQTINYMVPCGGHGGVLFRSSFKRTCLGEHG